MSSLEPTRVYVTADVECSEERLVRGKVRPPLGYDLRMWGRFTNQKDALGVPLIMGELERHGFSGTFFVEPFSSEYFGEDGLREVVTSMVTRGHDVQVHGHPIQRRADFRSRGEEPVNDDIGSYAPPVQAKLLREAKEILHRAGAPAERLTAFRAGNFGAANSTWAAMKEAGLVLSSNYNPCYFDKNCRMRFNGAEVGLFRSPVEGVYELPVTCFVEGNGGHRHLQITAVSAREMMDSLWQCRALGIREVTVVTHSFELYFIDDVERRRGRVNKVNLERLRALLAFLARHHHDFSVETVGALARRLPSSGESLARLPPRTTYPRGKRREKALRLVGQAVKRLHGALPVG